MESAERAVVGKIVRPHGVKGDVLVWPTGDDVDRFAPGQVLLAVGGAAAEADGRPDAAQVLTIRGRHEANGLWRLTFAEITDRDQAEELGRATLYQEVERLPKLPEGEYYHFELVGLRVRKADGSELGTLVRVHELPGADVFEVRSADELREWMIPSRRVYIDRIDVEHKELVLHECEDLLKAVEAAARRPEGHIRPRDRRPQKAKKGKAKTGNRP